MPGETRFQVREPRIGRAEPPSAKAADVLEAGKVGKPHSGVRPGSERWEALRGYPNGQR